MRTLLITLAACAFALAGSLPVSGTEISSGHTEYDSETGNFILSEGVELTTEGLLADEPVTVNAEKIVFNERTSHLRSYGRTYLALEESGIYLSGEDLTYAGENQTGSMQQIRAKLPVEVASGIRSALEGESVTGRVAGSGEQQAVDRFIAERSALYVIRGDLKFSSGAGDYPELEFRNVRLASSPRESSSLYIQVRSMTVRPGNYVRLRSIRMRLRGLTVLFWPAYTVALDPDPGGFNTGLPTLQSNETAGTLVGLTPTYSFAELPLRATAHLNYSSREDFFSGLELSSGEPGDGAGEFSFLTGDFAGEDREGNSVFLHRPWTLQWERDIALQPDALGSLELSAGYGEHEELSFPELDWPRVVEDHRGRVQGRLNFSTLEMGEHWSLTSSLFGRLYHYRDRDDFYRVGGGRVGLNYRSGLGNNYLAYTHRERTGPTPFVSDENFFEKEVEAGAITRINDNWLLSSDLRHNLEENETEALRLRLHYLYPSYNMQFYYNFADRGFGVSFGLLGSDHYNPAPPEEVREHRGYAPSGSE